MGTEEHVQTFLPVQMAKLCSAENEIIDMLDTSPDDGSQSAAAGKGKEINEKSRKYRSTTAICDTIFGYAYECQQKVDDETDDLGLESLDDLDELEVTEDDAATPL
ncbi:hypothetical protein TGAMA5MH_00479 [Trichoderma gamsii]|uniref:Uncharacterized protein n=1 Tax=Trichoderma gamsii TaxID=398673 RepID=A0A2K0TSG6_9HYPO|nr:hypothetical protein TGAMA5MH_00479 [Trichoderma gamsii]